MKQHMTIAAEGKPGCVILTQPGATAAERHAADELAGFLCQITGTVFEIRECDRDAPPSAIVIGPGPLARELFADVPWESLGGEQAIIRAGGGRLLLAGGRPRGTLYAVYRFLQEFCGVRWWAPWAADVPAQPNLVVGDLALDETPAFFFRPGAAGRILRKASGVVQLD